MYKESKILSQRQDELTRMYGVYGTDWKDDWPSYFFLKSDLSFCREKYANRHEIFEVFKYFALWVGLAAIGVIVAVFNKNALIGISWAFGSAILVAIVYYLVYYVFYKNKRAKLEHVIGPYYVKYDEVTLKQYLKNEDYRPPCLPPQPKAPLFSDTYFFVTDEDEEEEEARRAARSKKKSKDDAESKPIISVEDGPVAEEKIDEVEEVPRDEAAEEEPKHGLGIDLRLVGNDDKAGGSNNAQPAVVSDSEPIPDREDTAPQTDEEGDCSREPEPTVSETPEEGTEVEAVRVIDAELPDESDNRDNTAQETVEDVSEEDAASRLKELAFLFESKSESVEEDDKEGLSEDQRFVVDDLYDKPSDDDYAEDDEDIIEDVIEYEDEIEYEDGDEDEIESEDEPEEEIDYEPEEDDESEVEDEPEEDDVPAEEDGGRLFAEDYMPTTDELLAALRMLRDS